MKRKKIDNFQFKTELLRKLKNIVPSCQAEISDDSKTSISFVLRDKKGSLRSNVIKIYRFHPGVLTTKRLFGRIFCSGEPASGFPREVYEYYDIHF